MATPSAPADLAGGVVDRGADPGPLRREGPHDRVRRRRHRQAHAGADEHQGRARPARSRSSTSARDSTMSDGRHGAQPAGDHELGAERADELRRAGRGDHQGRRRAAAARTPRLERGVARARTAGTGDTKNSAPNMAKNTSVTATEAAENRGLAKMRMSRSGWSRVALPEPEGDQQHDRRDEGRRRSRDRDQPDVGPSMIAVQQQDQPGRRQHGADEVEAGACSSLVLGTSDRPRRWRTTITTGR